MNREVGFYWVKLWAGEDWTVGYYDGTPSYPWQVCGAEGTWKDHQIDVVGDPIPRPKE